MPTSLLKQTVLMVEDISDGTYMYTAQAFFCFLCSSTNVDDGLSSTISCLFVNKGLFTLDGDGTLLWSYTDPIISSQIANISSVPLLIGIASVIDTGTQITTFENGIFKWQQMISNLSDPQETISKWSVGFVEPSYFSIQLGDGRFALYDYSQGMCWAAINLEHGGEQYTIVSVTSSIDEFIYVVGIRGSERAQKRNCAVFAFKIGDVTYRLQTRWVYEYECNAEIAALGMSVYAAIPDNDTSSYPVGTIITYGIDDSTKNLGLLGIRDAKEYKAEYLWKLEVNSFCGMGYLIDPKDMEFGSNGAWICDYYQNDTLLMKQVNLTNGDMIASIDVNAIMFDVFEGFRNWKSVEKVSITSRGVSGITEDMKHSVIVLCVDVRYEDQNSVISEQNMLIVIDVDGKYLLSWFMFDGESRCIGQLSATHDGRLVIPMNDGMSVVAISA